MDDMAISIMLIPYHNVTCYLFCGSQLWRTMMALQLAITTIWRRKMNHDDNDNKKTITQSTVMMKIKKVLMRSTTLTTTATKFMILMLSM